MYGGLEKPARCDWLYSNKYTTQYNHYSKAGQSSVMQLDLKTSFQMESYLYQRRLVSLESEHAKHMHLDRDVKTHSEGEH